MVHNNLSNSSLGDGNEIKMTKVHPMAATASVEPSRFANLCHDYKNAVECLRQCKSLVEDLQSQLVSKKSLVEELRSQLAARDERIASLEEKIVKMSLELASARMSEEELKLFKRLATMNDSGYSLNLNGSDEDVRSSNRAVSPRSRSSFRCMGSSTA